MNSLMLSTMRKNKDGGVTLYIQKDAPAGDLKAIWLPGRFTFPTAR